MGARRKVDGGRVWVWQENQERPSGGSLACIVQSANFAHAWQTGRQRRRRTKRGERASAIPQFATFHRARDRIACRLLARLNHGGGKPFRRGPSGPRLAAPR